MTDWRETGPGQLVEAHLSRPANTRRGYAFDLRAFALWRGANLEDAVRELLDSGRGGAKRTVLGWINEQRRRNLSGNTIRRRVGALTSLLALAEDLEVIDWTVGRLPLPPANRVRDVTGPDLVTCDRLFVLCREQGGPIGRRNEALLAALYWEGLRAAEVLSIRWPDDVVLNARPAQVRILAKRGQGRVSVAVCTKTRERLTAWLTERGTTPGPFFLACRQAGKPTERGLSYEGLRAAVRSMGNRVGVRLWCHALRHAALTHLALFTHDSPAWGCGFSRHRDVKAWAGYLDRGVSHVSGAELLSRRQYLSGDTRPGTDNQ